MEKELKEKLKHIHIGKTIKKIAAEKGISVIELANKLNCSRINVYSIYKRKSIDTETLIDISFILKHNFIIEQYGFFLFSDDLLLSSMRFIVEFNKDDICVRNLENKTIIAVFHKK
jgi:DNA-binding Xre family transcriptional regulator